MADDDNGSSGGFFTRKVGPLPVWAWGALVFVGTLGVLMVAKSRQSSAGGSGGGGDVAFQSGQGNSLTYDTTSTVVSNMGPAAGGGTISGGYTNEVTQTASNGAPTPTPVTGPSTPHRHHHWRDDSDNSWNDDSNDSGDDYSDDGDDSSDDSDDD